MEDLVAFILPFFAVIPLFFIGEMPRCCISSKKRFLVAFSVFLWFLVGPIFLIIKLIHIYRFRIYPTKKKAVETAEEEESWEKWRDKTIEGEPT